MSSDVITTFDVVFCFFNLIVCRSCQSSGTTPRRSASPSNSRWRHCRPTRWPTSGGRVRRSTSTSTNSGKSSGPSDLSSTTASARTQCWIRSVCSFYYYNSDNNMQTYKRLKITLFIRTKHIFEAILFFKRRNNRCSEECFNSENNVIIIIIKDIYDAPG